MTKLSCLTKALATGLCAALLVACGGGSGGGQPVAPEPPANRSPVASAGAAQSVSAGTAVTLDGRLDTAPGQLFLAGGAMVFTVGTSVYRQSLE